MEHLKKELIKELHEVEEKVKENKGISIEDVAMAYYLAKTYHYLCEIKEDKDEYMSTRKDEQPHKGIY